MACMPALTLSLIWTAPVLRMALVFLNSYKIGDYVSDSHPLSRLPTPAGGHSLS